MSTFTSVTDKVNACFLDGCALRLGLFVMHTLQEKFRIIGYVELRLWKPHVWAQRLRAREKRERERKRDTHTDRQVHWRIQWLVTTLPRQIYIVSSMAGSLATSSKSHQDLYAKTEVKVVCQKLYVKTCSTLNLSLRLRLRCVVVNHGRELLYQPFFPLLFSWCCKWSSLRKAQRRLTGAILVEVMLC